MTLMERTVMDTTQPVQNLLRCFLLRSELERRREEMMTEELALR